MPGNTQGTNTFEGRFKFYSSPSAFSVGSSTNQTTASHWTATTGADAYQIPTGIAVAASGATVLSWSTGTEDYFLGAYDWNTATVGTPYSSLNRYGGIIYDSASNDQWTCFRFYNDDEGYIGVPANTYLIGTWSCGDPLVGTAGDLSALYIAFVMYYA